ncbi:MAG TPA: hypothetical protein VFL14_01830, partial [Xanthomonadales bacterium]|nr:hypothetical protein [Xanthomonadales bacterium]
SPAERVVIPANSEIQCLTRLPHLFVIPAKAGIHFALRRVVATELAGVARRPLRAARTLEPGLRRVDDEPPGGH